MIISRRSRRGLVAAAATALALAAMAATGTAHAGVRTDSATDTSLHDVLLVGNSASGTVSFLDGRTFANLGSLNVVPDL